jgi:CRP-like cAMP-binding protein
VNLKAVVMGRQDFLLKPISILDVKNPLSSPQLLYPVFQNKLNTIMYEQLKQTFEKIAPLDDSEWSMIQSAFTPLKVPANTMLTSIGETERKIYFVVEGIIRLFCHNLKDEEVTIFLFRENLFASSYPSFVTQTPGNQALQTITDCSLLSMDKQKEAEASFCRAVAVAGEQEAKTLELRATMSLARLWQKQDRVILV